MAKIGRPKLERQTPKSTFIRLSDEELKVIDEFLDRQSTGVIGGEKITVAAFGRALMLREALLPKIRKALHLFRHDQFSLETMVRTLGLTEAIKYPVLAALRHMASEGELGQSSSTDFFVPKVPK